MGPRHSVRKAAKKAGPVRKINHTQPRNRYNTGHFSRCPPAGRPVFHLVFGWANGYNDSCNVRQKSRCVWSCTLRRQGAGCANTSLLLALRFCALSTIIHDISGKNNRLTPFSLKSSIKKPPAVGDSSNSGRLFVWERLYGQRVIPGWPGVRGRGHPFCPCR